MARFTVAQLNSYIADQYNTLWASGQEKTIQEMREATTSIMQEGFRQLTDVSPAVGTMFLIGSDPDNHFDLQMLQEGDAGSIELDDELTGFQLVPLFTGTGDGQVNPTAGTVIPSIPFDGESEIKQGEDVNTENMLKVEYQGFYNVVASCKPTVPNQQNREIETDLFVFDSSGNAIRSLGFIASANQSNSNRSFTQNIPNVNLNPDFLAAGEYLGLVARKFAGEGNTNVRFTKGFIQIKLAGFGQ